MCEYVQSELTVYKVILSMGVSSKFLLFHLVNMFGVQIVFGVVIFCIFFKVNKSHNNSKTNNEVILLTSIVCVLHLCAAPDSQGGGRGGCWGVQSTGTGDGWMEIIFSWARERHTAGLLGGMFLH